MTQFDYFPRFNSIEELNNYFSNLEKEKEIYNKEVLPEIISDELLIWAEYLNYDYEYVIMAMYN